MQRYQPPHTRQRPPRHLPGDSSSSSNSVRVDSQRISDDNLLKPGPSIPRRNENPVNNFAPRPTRAPSDFSSDKYVPRQSRRDWSSAASNSASLGTSVLASPASDIRPMRPGVGGKVKVGEMELMQSVSRSGGDGANGDALKDWGTQERYRQYIDERIDSHYKTFDTPRHTPPKKGSREKEELEGLASIVLLFRKLREGVVASHRIDAFAIEVFESSAHLAILAQNRPQLLSALSGLIPGLYKAHDDIKDNSKTRTPSEPSDRVEVDVTAQMRDLNLLAREKDRRVEFASLLLLYHLVVSGRQTFFDTLMGLTCPPRRDMARSRDPFLNDPNTSIPRSDGGAKSETKTESEKGHGTPDGHPFVSLDDVGFARKAAIALGEETFSPLMYFNLISTSKPSATITYESAILRWKEGEVRDKTWEIMKKGYLSVGVEWAGKFAGIDVKEVKAWAEGKEGKMEAGIVKLR
ncbi:hypothetical protein IAR55_002511 [Kwoniella newhampshirensis]|uniref:Uncharacterized protein n=1 Tax=Kwoniella newhampshirensis TaxID=1651941 RepID=A0AAW0Z1P3_9TREE